MEMTREMVNGVIKVEVNELCNSSYFKTAVNYIGSDIVAYEKKVAVIFDLIKTALDSVTWELKMRAWRLGIRHFDVYDYVRKYGVYDAIEEIILEEMNYIFSDGE